MKKETKNTVPSTSKETTMNTTNSTSSEHTNHPPKEMTLSELLEVPVYVRVSHSHPAMSNLLATKMGEGMRLKQNDLCTLLLNPTVKVEYVVLKEDIKDATGEDLTSVLPDYVSASLIIAEKLTEDGPLRELRDAINQVEESGLNSKVITAMFPTPLGSNPFLVTFLKEKAGEIISLSQGLFQGYQRQQNASHMNHFQAFGGQMNPMYPGPPMYNPAPTPWNLYSQGGFQPPQGMMPPMQPMGQMKQAGIQAGIQGMARDLFGMTHGSFPQAPGNGWNQMPQQPNSMPPRPQSSAHWTPPHPQLSQGLPVQYSANFVLKTLDDVEHAQAFLNLVRDKFTPKK